MPPPPLTPDEEERRRLQEQATGWDALQALIPGATLPESILGGIRGVAGEAASIQPGDLGQEGALGILQRLGSAGLIGAVDPVERGQRASQQFLFGTGGGQGRPLPPQAASVPGAVRPTPPATPGSEPFMGPLQEGSQATQAVPTPTLRLLQSQRTPDGRVVQSEITPQEWKARALLSQGGMGGTQSGESGTVNPRGFQVRQGPGAFSPGRQVEDVLQEQGEDLTSLGERQILQESPAVQALLREAQQNEFVRRTQAAGIGDLDLRRRLLTAQAGTAEEGLRRLQDPTVEAQEQMALYDFIQKRLTPEVQQRVEGKLKLAVDAMTQQAGVPPSPQVIEAMRQAITDQESGGAFTTLAQRRQLLDPRFTPRYF